jgi:hypothetical protein
MAITCHSLTALSQLPGTFYFLCLKRLVFVSRNPSTLSRMKYSSDLFFLQHSFTHNDTENVIKCAPISTGKYFKLAGKRANIKNWQKSILLMNNDVRC